MHVILFTWREELQRALKQQNEWEIFHLLCAEWRGSLSSFSSESFYFIFVRIFRYTLKIEPGAPFKVELGVGLSSRICKQLWIYNIYFL